jgi:hypothetical protein
MSGRQVSSISFFLLAVVSLMMTAARAQNPNLFPVSDVNVTFYSPLGASCFTITSMFQGGPPSTCPGEGQDVIFADQSQGALSTVQFSTTAPVTGSALRLYVGGDGPPNNYRDLQQFTFSYESSPGVYTAVATWTPQHPEPNVFVVNLASAITAQNFQAQFTQYGTGGPRVGEIDAFASAIGSSTISPTSLNLGNALVGATTKSKTAVITNTAGVPLNIFGIIPSGDFVESDTCSTTLAPGATCDISITFSPTVTGTIPGVVEIDDDGAGSPHILAVTGKGVYPVAPNPASINFGSDGVGVTSAPKTVTLSNYTASSQGFSFVASSNYAVAGSGTKPCNGTLAPKATCTLSVTFTPSADGAVAGAVSISGGGFPTQIVALTGTGTGGGTSPLTFSPTTISLASTWVGRRSAAKTLTVKNASASAVNITNFATTSEFSVIGSGVTPCGGVLGVNASCTVDVKFSPVTAGKISGSLAFMDNASIGTQVVSVSGTGLSLVTITPAGLTFAPQTVGTTSGPKTMTIANNQSVSLALTSVVASGEYSVAPGSTNPCGSGLAAGAQCNLAVTFTPSNKGTIKGAITVTHNAGGSPQVLGLSGTGQ